MLCYQSRLLSVDKQGSLLGLPPMQFDKHRQVSIFCHAMLPVEYRHINHVHLSVATKGENGHVAYVCLSV